MREFLAFVLSAFAQLAAPFAHARNLNMADFGANAGNWTFSNVSIDAADGTGLTFGNSSAIRLNDDASIAAPA